MRPVYKDAEDAFRAYKNGVLDDIEKEDTRNAQRLRLDDVRTRWQAIGEYAAPGQGVRLGTADGNFYGVVLHVETTGKTKNPLALGAWKITIALADSARQMTVPFSQFYTERTKPDEIQNSQIEISGVTDYLGAPLLDAFDDMQTERRESRVIVTGNLLAGYDFVGGKGTITNFVDAEKGLRQGIVMPRDFEAEKFLAKAPATFRSPDQMFRFLREGDKRIIKATDGLAMLTKSVNGDIVIMTDGGRGKGGKYFLNRLVLAAAGQDFVKTGSTMRLTLPPNRASAVIQEMQNLGATFQAESHVDEAKAIIGPSQAQSLASAVKAKKIIRALRVGDYSGPNHRSQNFAQGRTEKGLSVYELDAKGQPVTPPGHPDYDSAWIEQDMRDRLAGDDPKWLVEGEVVGIGGDGEPLLRKVRTIGEWPEALDDSSSLASKPISQELLMTQAQMEELADIVWRVSGLPKTIFQERIAMNDEAAANWGETPDSAEAAGLYESYGHTPIGATIRISLAHGEPTVAYHESFHHLQAWFFKDRDRAILKQSTAALKKIVATGRADPDRMAQVEIEAEAFAIYMTDPAGTRLPAAVKSIFARLRRLIRSVKSWLDGNGFRTWEDIFAEAAAGKIHQRLTNEESAIGLYSHASTVNSAAFKEWFGDSRVRRKGGEPLVVYHGTSADFERFDSGKSGSNTGDKDAKKGFFFSSSPVTAQGYGELNGHKQTGARIMPVYLKIENPVEVDWRHGRYDGSAFDGIIQEAKNKGRDGVIIRNVDDDVDEDSPSSHVFVVFRPEQIKSATGNNGAFDPNNPSILASTVSQRRANVVPADRPQGFLAKGQFVDRTLRVIPSVLGGLNSEGAWRPSKFLHDEVKKTITERKIDPNGKFGWANSFVENARRNLIDRYGLDKDYVARDRLTGLDKRAILTEAQGILEHLKKNLVDANEAKVLQAILTGEAVDNDALNALALPIRQSLDQLGEEAVQLGLISRESYERNRATYIHRVYMKNEDDAHALGRWASRIMERRRKRIIGDQMKGRGIFLDIEAKRLTEADPEWTEAQRGKPFKGEKFYMFDFEDTQADALGGPEKKRVRRREFWPVDRPIPAKYKSGRWIEKGIWEVRGDKKGQGYTIWRDYSPEERTRMGEILDARYTLGKTYMLMANDLATGRFFKDVAENEAWASTMEPAGSWKEASAYRRFWNDPEIGWVRVPEDSIKDTGGKKKWGALAGKWVRAEIWKDLNELDIQNRPSSWRRLLTTWKINMTARNPVVHMNNIMSNLMFMDLADIRLQDLAAGINSYIRKDAHYRDAAAHGAFGSDLLSQEIRDQVLKPILDEIRNAQSSGVNPWLAKAGIAGKLASLLGAGIKGADGKMIEAYQAEDAIFRMATYRRRLSMGSTPEQAADIARQTYLDYDIRAPLVNAARNTVLPFISYTYRAAPIIAQAIAERPWKMAKYFALFYAANALAYGWDDDDDEERERAAMRAGEQGKTWLGVPRMMRMPYSDERGLPVFLDIRRWTPAGDVFDTSPGQAAVGVPAPLQFNGPLVTAAEILLFNKQTFTGKPITLESDTVLDKAGKIADYLWKAWMPNAIWIPNSRAQDKVENAYKGGVDKFTGQTYSMREALLSSVGIKLAPLDVDQGIKFRQFEFQKERTELRKNLRDLSSQRDRNLISQAEFEKGTAHQLEKMKNLGDRHKAFDEKISKK
jgi:hypothetical protein